jgi:hypothetical protein
MTLTLDAAEAEAERLAAQHTEWTEKRAQLVSTLERMEADAGRVALAGTSTTKIAGDITRTQAEIRIADQALAEVERQQQGAGRVLKQARIDDLYQRAAAKRAEAAAIVEQARPHLEALEAIEGVRLVLERGRSVNLEMEAYRLERNAEYLEDRLDEVAA